MEQRYQEAFMRVDADKSGSISPDELRTMMQDLGEEMDDGELQEIIDEADIDGDGHIDYKEFLQLMKARKRILALATSMSHQGLVVPEEEAQAAGAQNSLPLPPLKLADLQSKRHLRQFDHYFSRPTPHCLKIGNQARTQELRRELMISQHAVEQLNGKVRQDVEWIYCQKWGIEKLQHVMQHIATGIMSSALRKWVEVVNFLRNKEKAERYLKRLTKLIERRQREEMSALAIQNIYRGNAARHRVAGIREQVREESAALCIQTRFRGHQGRAFFAERQEQSAAALAIQKRYRGFQSKLVIEERRRTRAAIKIQCAWRMRNGRLSYHLKLQAKKELDEERRAAAVQIQSMYRAQAGRAAASGLREQANEDEALSKEQDAEAESAVMIQARWRGHSHRTEVTNSVMAEEQQQKEQDIAAAQIQSMYRAKHGRAEAETQRQQLVLERQELNTAAVKIQCAFRGKEARAAAKRKRDQHAGAAAAAMRRLQEAEEEAAAVKMQCLYRAKKAKKEMEKKLREIDERRWRQEQLQLDAKEVQEQQEAAVHIQCVFRQNSAQKALEARRKALSLDLATAASESDALAMRNRHTQEAAALRIQSAFRTRKAKREFRSLQDSKFKLLQSERDELEAEAQELAALKMQSHMRGHIARKAAEQKKAELQGNFAAEQKRREEERIAAMLAQEQATQQAEEREMAAIKLQCASRRRKAQREYQERVTKRQEELAAAKQAADEAKAAIQIQCKMRQKAARGEMDKKKEEHRQKLEELREQEAAQHELEELQRQQEEELAAMRIQVGISINECRFRARPA
eukprot:g115.t1